jgi:hypothetical protein
MLHCTNNNIRQRDKEKKFISMYRLAPRTNLTMISFLFLNKTFLFFVVLPPASGLTITAFLKSGICNDIQRITAGSAKRLSTGISKNPYES